MPMWMIRSNAGLIFDDFVEKGVVALSWSELGDLRNFSGKPGAISAYSKIWPSQNEQSVRTCVNMLFRFLSEMTIGDGVITYDPKRRLYAVGQVASDYLYEHEAIVVGDNSWPHLRRVDWNERQFSRDELPQFARNSLGSTLAIFRVPDKVERAIEAVFDPSSFPLADAEEVIESAQSATLTQVETDAIERTKDIVAKLDWQQMQEIVAGLLRALGYSTRISPEGPDRGKDIIASPDGFGFEDPRIVVEVKHRPNTSMGGPEIRSFLGGRQAGDKGLYVSTGGFTKDAKYEADRSNIPLALMTLEDLVESLIEHYEKLDEQTKQLIPLRKVFWPIEY